MNTPDPGAGDPQQVLDRHRALPLMQRLRLLAGLGCTGSLIISDDVTLGVIFFHEGAVVDAIVTDGPWIGEGAQAVAFLANLESSNATYETTSHFGKPTVDVGLAALEMQVEQIRPLLLPVLKAERPVAPRAHTLEAAERPAASNPPAVPPQRKGVRMAPLESNLIELRDIRGYLGSGILDSTGDLLAADEADGLDIALLGALCTDLLRSADDACRRLGLVGCASTTLHTEKGVVVLRRAERNGCAPVYLMGVVKSDGNPALLRMQLEKLAPRVLERLA